MTTELSVDDRLAMTADYLAMERATVQRACERLASLRHNLDPVGRGELTTVVLELVDLAAGLSKRQVELVEVRARLRAVP